MRRGVNLKHRAKGNEFVLAEIISLFNFQVVLELTSRSFYPLSITFTAHRVISKP